MSLKMSKQAIIELLNSNAAKYRKTHSRKAKGELLPNQHLSSSELENHCFFSHEAKRTDKLIKNKCIKFFINIYLLYIR